MRDRLFSISTSKHYCGRRLDGSGVLTKRTKDVGLNEQLLPFCCLWSSLADRVAVGVFDGELAEAVQKVLRTPFGLTVPLNSVPQGINVIYCEVLGCRCVRLSEMCIVHKHDGNGVTA